MWLIIISYQLSKTSEVVGLKKNVLWSLIIFNMFIFSSCSGNGKVVEKNDNGFDIKAATNIIDNYMGLLISEDYQGAERLYSKDLVKKSIIDSTTAMNVRGYNIEETSEIGKLGSFKIKVSRVDTSKSSATLETYSIKVEKSGNDYKISEIKSEMEKEAFVQGGGLRLRDKENVKTNLILDMAGMPQYVYSKDDGGVAFKLETPLNNFGNIAFSYKGDSLGVTSYGKDVFAGVVKIDEALAAQGTESKSGSGSDGGSSSGGGNSSLMAKEKPIGKGIVTLDYLKNSKVDFMVFSQDEKFVMLQYTKLGAWNCIRIYESYNGEMIPFKFEEKYAMDKVNIKYSSFGKDVLNYEVIPKSNAGKEENQLNGKWQLSLKDFTTKKL